MDICEFILGGNKACIHKKVVLAPCWSPQSVGISNCRLISSHPCQIWDCSIHGIEFTYIVSGVGASLCMDIVMSLNETSCNSILFIGSAGALKRGINIGDFAVPQGSISAEGASRYVEESISEDVFGTVYFAEKELQKHLYHFIKEKNVNVHEGLGISVESIYLQYKHINEIYDFNSEYIDMEASAFLAATNNLNMKAAVVFCVSDNIAQNEPLYLIPQTKIAYRKQIRKDFMPDVIEEFLTWKE